MGATRGRSWRKSLTGALAGLAVLAGGRGRPLVVLATLAALTVGGAFYARYRWPEFLSSRRHYELSAENIVVTPQPKWIHTDVKSEVIRNAHLTDLDALDKNLTNRVAAAFAVHTWVAKVRRVSKSAGSIAGEQPGPRVDVQLVYRRPVAMVEVRSAGRPGLLPVDEQGVLLPPEDFSPNQARNYLRIAVADTKPVGPVGTAWGDPRVAGAAEVAAAWQQVNLQDGATAAASGTGTGGGQAVWKKLGLYRIQAAARGTAPRGRAADIDYVLFTRHGRRILWGHAPGAEQSGEAVASQKIARLMEHAQARGSLDEDDQGDIDVRDAQTLRVLPRTARLGTGH